MIPEAQTAATALPPFISSFHRKTRGCSPGRVYCPGAPRAFRGTSPAEPFSTHMIPTRFTSRDKSRTRFILCAAFTAAVCWVAAPADVSAQPLAPPAAAPAFSQIIIFGDDFSDNGNFRHRAEDDWNLSYPGGAYNYSDGRFTNSSDTSPGSDLYSGLWHEQLSRIFLGRSAETPREEGGNVFAFAGSTTEDGTRKKSIVGIFGNDVDVTVDNMSEQVDDYITRRGVDPNALFVLWAGANDLLHEDDPANVAATAGRVALLMNRLADAGARKFLIPNVPPLGALPLFGDDGDAQEAKNTASAEYRAELQSSLAAVVDDLAARGVQAQLYAVDVWSLFIREAADPLCYGFTDIHHPAQGEDVDPDKHLFWDEEHFTTAAHYHIALEANRVLTGTAVAPGRTVNLSTRVALTDGTVAFGGFIITGTEPKRVLIRGIGPSLRDRGISNALGNPLIQLFDSNGEPGPVNEDWQDSPQADEIAATGLAPDHRLESALLRTLAPGSYSVRLRGDSGPGVGLVEIYDLNTEADSTLANVSTRGPVGTGDNVMVAGMIIDSGGEAIVVVRAIGPSLAAAGVAAPLQDPILDLRNSNGDLISTNDNWKDGQAVAARATLLAPSDEREAVITASVTPGSYTAIVRGRDDTVGEALVEVYRLP